MVKRSNSQKRIVVPTSSPKNRPSKKLPFKPKPTVRFRVPKGNLFVGSYYRIPVTVRGIPFDDVQFVVSGGAKAGLISPSRDLTFKAAQPHIMLCVGFEPGTYVIEARVLATGVVLGQMKFTSDALWRNEDLGPSKWFTGISQGYSAGSAWGGGPGVPQNTNVVPATGTRRIAILLVDTSSQRYTTDAATLQSYRDRWMDALINGVTSGGVTRSVRQFYREASYGNFDISAAVFGPVSLSGTFDDYFNSDGTTKDGFHQACFTAADSLINYNDFDTLVCVSQHVDGPPQQFAWPYSSIGSWGPYTTSEGDKNYGVISMPNDWQSLDGRTIYETFAHELGHNLGLGDEYTLSVPGRNLGGWELMDSDGPWPHFSIAHRMMLGWVQPGWLQTFNFQSMASPVDQTISLTPIEKGVPPTGKKTGIEIRIADGWNYYFEYREGQASQIGDRSLPTDNRILGTDVVSAPFTPPLLRPNLLLLNNDIDGDGSVLSNGQDYKETDTTDPVYPTDFKVDVSGLDGTKADVRVRYGVNSRPDPSIRPWPASPDRQWQSPDIEVRNARNMADASWFNVPWVGNPNTVIARVKNNGALDAPQVRVNFYVKDYNVGGTPETFLGTDVRDVPAGTTIDFQGNWTPPSTGHFCIVVRIPLYQLPANPAVVEMTELNNVAQSNYDRFISGTSSPPSREISEILVGNPYPIRTRIWIVAGNSNPLYRSYLEHSSLVLDPGEARSLAVMYEYAPDQLTNDLYPRDLKPRYREMQKVPNRVKFAAFVEDPRDHPRHAKQILGGAEAEIVTGRKTKFERLVFVGHSLRGRVVTIDDGKGVRSGKVLIRLTNRTGTTDSVNYQTATLQNGEFAIEFKHDANLVKAYFLPSAGFTDCESDERKVL